jgi:hypothetical protein
MPNRQASNANDQKDASKKQSANQGKHQDMIRTSEERKRAQGEGLKVEPKGQETRNSK